nr:ubiquinol-cytochrome-c reductase complex assembly factor 2-like [Globicephala melas]
MAASCYQNFLKLCEEWPVDKTKRGRDLGAYQWERVAHAFREGENTQIAEPEACDQLYESLVLLHSSYYKHKYPRPRDTSFSGLSLEEYKLVLSTDTLEEFKEMNKGVWKELQEKFAPKDP